MQYYRKRYNFYFNRYPRYRRAYTRASRYTSGTQRRSTGNQVAARQQRDATQVNLSIPSQISCYSATRQIAVPGTDQTIEIFAGTGVINVWDLLRKSEFYQNYASMYDQVKIDKATLKLTPYQFPIFNNSTATNNIGGYYNSYTIVTAWDRTGLSEEQTKLVNIDTHHVIPGTAEDARNRVIGYDDNNDGFYLNLSARDAATYSSAINRNVTPNSTTAITRTIYPSTMSEKSYYVNTADLDKWYNNYDYNTGRFFGIVNPFVVSGEAITGEGADSNPITVPQFPLTLLQSKALAKNPAFLLETAEVPFKPTLLVGCLNDTINITVGDNDEVQFLPRMRFTVESDIVVTFRGLRKAAVVK